MDSRQTNYEVYAKRNARADWALVGSFQDREGAIAAAQTLYEERPGGSVRVDKAIFDPDSGAYQTVSIFGLGDVDPSLRARDGNTAEPPCSLPEDLGTVHARRVIARVLKDWLDRERATPLELLHRPDLAEKLEGEGTMLQHAIQKTAIAQASEFDANVQHFVKRLNELTEKSITALLEKDKKGKLPKIGPAGFGALAGALGEKHVFGMCTAVAGALQPAKGWADKVHTLLGLAASLEDCSCRDAALAVVDDFLGEALAVPAAADSLSPEAETLGDRLEAFVAIAGGKEASLANEEARTLAARFRAKELRGARAALIRRVLAELLRPQRLKPGDFWNEVHQMRRLADAMIAMAGPDLPPEDIGEAFVYRSGRLVQPEAIDEALAGATTAAEEVERLIRLEQALAGPMAKKKLASYLRASLGSHRTEAELTKGAGKPLERAARIAGFQQAILSSRLPGEEKQEIAAVFDRLCMATLREARVFETIAGGGGPPLDRAAALLKLAARGGLTKGRASAEASNHAQALLRQAMRDGVVEPDRLSALKSLLEDIAA
jgi:hypothetical protein